MDKIHEMGFQPFDQFFSHWALLTAGRPARFNSCTIGWGSMGSIWDGALPLHQGACITVFVHPGRYTLQFMRENPVFTVSFLPAEYKKAMVYMGRHSGRDENKAANAGLTPVPMGDSVAYKEAEISFLCRKIYSHQLTKEDLAPEIQDYYKANPKVYPVDGDGDWQAHWVFMGQILDVNDKR